MGYFGNVQTAADAVRARVRTVPSTAIILGSGLGDFAGSLGSATSIKYSDLPHWPVSSVPGHEGRLVIGSAGGRRIAGLAGRGPLYQGDGGPLPSVRGVRRSDGDLCDACAGASWRQAVAADQRRWRREYGAVARCAD